MKNISFRLELLTFELWIHPYIVHQGRFRMLLSCQLSIQSALLLRQPKMYQVFCWWCWGKTTKIFFIHEKQGFSRILRKIAPIFWWCFTRISNQTSSWFVKFRQKWWFCPLIFFQPKSFYHPIFLWHCRLAGILIRRDFKAQQRHFFPSSPH